MNHNKVQKRLLLYLDGELLEPERNEIQEHLLGCYTCNKRLEKLSKVWKFEGAEKQAKPSPHLWVRLEARIDEYNRHPYFVADFLERFAPIPRLAAVLALLVSGIFLGVQLGSIPAPSAAKSDAAQSYIQERERFFSSIYLDSFKDLLPESIGGVYVTFASMNE